MSTILIIDKRHEEMKTYLDELSDEGHVVMGTTAADQGVRLLQSNPGIDMVVLDVAVGFGPLQDIRRLRPDIPVLLSCEHTDFKKDFESWLADDYLVKTSNMKALKSRIKEFLNRYRPG